MKKEISNELKEEMSNLFETEERVYNNVIDLGSNIVAFTSLNARGPEKTIAKKFISSEYLCTIRHIKLTLQQANILQSQALRYQKKISVY